MSLKNLTEEDVHQAMGAMAGVRAVTLFNMELMGSVETLSGIADQHGPRTLADIMYLQYAILHDRHIDHDPEDSEILSVIKLLPSAKRWMGFINVNSQGDITQKNVVDEPGNKDRIKLAMNAIKGFAIETGLDVDSELDAAISDLVADMMHLCDDKGLDFDSLISRARDNHQEEIAEDRLLAMVGYPEM